MHVSLRKFPKQLAALLISPCTPSAAGQVQVLSHAGIDVPREKVDHLFNLTCGVVAKEFHLGDASEMRVPVTLVLGESRDGLGGDETNQVFTIYMSRWEEMMFATSVRRIALQHLLSRDRKARIVRESLRRTNLAAPISVSALRPSAARQSLRNDFAPASPRAAINPAARCFTSAAFPFPAEGVDRHRSPAFCPPGAQFAP